MGAYVHGLFATIASAPPGSRSLGARSELAYEAQVERTLDELAAHLGRAYRSRRPSQPREMKRERADRERLQQAGDAIEAQRRTGCRPRRPHSGHRP